MIKRSHVLAVAILGLSNLGAMHVGYQKGTSFNSPVVISLPSPKGGDDAPTVHDTFEDAWLDAEIDSLPDERTYSKEEELCMQQNIFFESRNQDIRGKLGVGFVVLNRVKDKRWPDTICEVVRDRKHGCQFSWHCDGKKDSPITTHAAEMMRWEEAGRLAAVLTNHLWRPVDITNGAVFYISKVAARKKRLDQFERLYEKTATLDDHLFYQ